jgi:hypothetical protein
MFSQKDIGVFEAFEKHLETTWLRWEWSFSSLELSSVPERVVE